MVEKNEITFLHFADKWICPDTGEIIPREVNRPGPRDSAVILTTNVVWLTWVPVSVLNLGAVLPGKGISYTTYSAT